MDHLDSLIDIPFHHRHQCWFCGEPSSTLFSFPSRHQTVLRCRHQQLTLPSCSECYSFAVKADKPLREIGEFIYGDSEIHSIWQVQAMVKKQLMQTYEKDLAIGLNWTEQTLKDAQFEGGNFASFQKSAWFMFEVAKSRVSFTGWKLVVSGVELMTEHCNSFSFDGVTYPSLADAIEHYSKNFSLNKSFFTQVVALYSGERFAEAVRFCRLYVGATPQERSLALNQLVATLNNA